MPAVSVIVPTYNEENYLRQALDSLVAQTLEDIEILLVNDGSTDQSADILREYAAHYPQFTLIDKPNGGYGSAVNAGLDAATGEYIGILEPDDFVDAHMFEDLYKAAHIDVTVQQSITERARARMEQGVAYGMQQDVEHGIDQGAETSSQGAETSSQVADAAPQDVNAPSQGIKAPYLVADIVKSSYYNYWDATMTMPATKAFPANMRDMTKRPTIGTVEDFPRMVEGHPSIWSCIYRRAFLEDHTLRMVEARGAGYVDNPWFYETMELADIVVWEPTPYYHYRLSNQDASGFTIRPDTMLDRLDDIFRFYEGRTPSQEHLWDCFVERTARFIVSIANSAAFSHPQPETFMRMRHMLQRLDRDEIMRNPLIDKETKDFALELRADDVAEGRVTTHAAVDRPQICVLIPVDNDSACVVDSVTSVLRHGIEDMEVLVWAARPCADCTQDFVEQIAARDKRVSFLQVPADEMLAQVSSPYMLLLRPKDRLKKAGIHVSLEVFTKSAADVIVNRLAGSDAYPSDAFSPRERPGTVLTLAPASYTGICLTTAVAKRCVAQVEPLLQDLSPREIALRLLFEADRVFFHAAGIRASLNRRRPHLSIRTPKHELDIEHMNTGMLLRLRDFFQESDLLTPLERCGVWRHYVAERICEDLASVRASDDFFELMRLEQSVSVPDLYGEVGGGKDEIFVRNDPEELLYFLMTDTDLFLRALGERDRESGRQREETLRRKLTQEQAQLATLRAELAELQKQADAHTLSGILRKGKRSIRRMISPE